MRSILVPVKSFATAKLRLAPVLTGPERAELARRLATHVIRASCSIVPNVVCDDLEVADWAISMGASVIWTPGLGLSGAVAAGVKQLAALGSELVVVAHADLPWAQDLDCIGTPGRVTLVPDTRYDGTNVAAVPTAAGFGFSYGAGSFARHCDEAERLGLTLDVVVDPRLAADVDVPDDLAHLAEGELVSIRAAARPISWP